MLLTLLLLLTFAFPSVQSKPASGVVNASDGVPIHYSVTGKGEPALVFIHCGSCNRNFWENQVAEFSKTNRVVTIDLPGHGESGLERKNWSIEGYGDDVKTVVTKLGLKRVVAELSNKREPEPEAKPVDMKLEVILLRVSDVDRAKAFYENLGWRLDIDLAHGDFRGVQITPHNSETSIIFGRGITPTETGAAHSLVLAVDDIDRARKELIARGVNVSEVFHYAGGPFNNTVQNPRVDGRDPEGRSYFSFASFEDPDGNNWLLQEITSRLPGREWKSAPPLASDVTALAELLRETGEHHDRFEKTHAEHHWWDWYAPYISVRQNGGSSEEASAAADRHMEEVLHVLPR